MKNIAKIEQTVVEGISKKILNHLARNSAFSRTDYLKCKLGIETFLIDVSKLIIIYGLAFVIGLAWQVFIVHISYMGIRLFSHGAHCKTSLECTLVSSVMLIGATLVINKIQIPNIILLVMFMINFILLWRYAPSATKKNGIENKSERKKKILKYKALITNGIIFLISSLMPRSIGVMLMTGAIMAALMTTPLLYKLLRQERI